MTTGENTAAGKPMLEVRGLARVFGSVPAVESVTFSACRGEIIGLLGPNGAGKTTTLRMLATALSPSAGTGRVAGFDLLSERGAVQRKIGYLPETPPLYGELTVVEYLLFVAELREIPRQRRRPEVAEVLRRCGLGEVQDRLCQHLSRGFRQRVGLAQAMVHHPEVIILDEPTSGLDPRQIIQIRRLILALAHGRLVIMSTHVLPEVIMVCNRVIIMNRGRIATDQGLNMLAGRQGLERAFMDCIGAEDESGIAGETHACAEC